MSTTSRFDDTGQPALPETICELYGQYNGLWHEGVSPKLGGALEAFDQRYLSNNIGGLILRFNCKQLTILPEELDSNSPIKVSILKHLPLDSGRQPTFVSETRSFLLLPEGSAVYDFSAAAEPRAHMEGMKLKEPTETRSSDNGLRELESELGLHDLTVGQAESLHEDFAYIKHHSRRSINLLRLLHLT